MLIAAQSFLIITQINCDVNKKFPCGIKTVPILLVKSGILCYNKCNLTSVERN